MSRLDIEEQPTFEDLELLAEVSQLLTLRDLDNVLQKVISLTSKAVGASRASLFLHKGDQVDWDHILVTRNLSRDESINVVKQVLSEGLAGWVYRNRKATIVEDTEKDKRWLTFPDDTSKTRSALCVPFILNNEVLAVVTLAHPEPQHFTPYHLRLVTIIANQATVAIRNAQLFSKLETQQRQLQAFLQAIPDVLLVLNKSGQVLMVNNAAVRLIGENNQDALLNRQLKEFAAIDDVFASIDEIIYKDSGEDDIEEWAFTVRSERRQQDFQVTISVWKEQEQIGGYVVVMHDITTLRDLNRFKDEMLRVASHDLRSPLSLIVGYVDIIGLDLPEDSPIQQYLDVVRRSTERMNNLLDDLLRVERVRSSPLELQEEIDIAKLVRVVLVNMRPSAEAKKQRLNSDVQLDNAPKFIADAVLIRQSMENLISNAIKYTPEGGEISVKAYIENERFYFTVTDTGIGIPQEHLSHIFESFYRVPHKTASAEKGTGLGLSLVKNVIERHDGEVWVTSEEGQGSTFGFWLPLKRKV